MMSNKVGPRDAAFVVSVLPFGTTEDEFAAFAKQQGYREIRRAPENRQTLSLLTVTYACDQPDTYVQYVFNHKVHIATARSHGPGRWFVSKALEQHFCIVDETEIRQRLASQDAGDRGLALAYVAEFAPAVFEQRLLDIFAQGAADRDADVREFSYLAMGIVGWRQFRPIAEAALQEENVETLRSQLQRLLTNLA